MPKYNVTDPDSGTTLVLDGDSPPTEDELTEIFSKVPKSKQPPYVTPEPVPTNPLERAAQDWQMGGMVRAPRGRSPTSLQESSLGISPEMIPSGAHTRFPALTIPLSAVAKTAAGVGAYMTSPQGAAETALAATPAAPVILAKWAYDMLKGGYSSVKDAVDTLGQMANEALSRGIISANQLGPVPEGTNTKDHIQRLAEDAVNAALMLTGGVGAAGHAVEGVARMLPEPDRFPTVQSPQSQAWAASFGTGERPVTEIAKPQAVVRPTQPYVPPEPGPMQPILTPRQRELMPQIETLQNLINTTSNPLSIRGLNQKLTMVRMEFENENAKGLPTYAPPPWQKPQSNFEERQRIPQGADVPPNAAEVRAGTGSATSDSGGAEPSREVQAPVAPNVAPPVVTTTLPPVPVPPPEPKPTLPTLTFDDFKKQYNETFRRMMGYSPDQAGSSVYAEKLAALSDQHPDWAAQAEGERAPETKLSIPETKPPADATKVPENGTEAPKDETPTVTPPVTELSPQERVELNELQIARKKRGKLGRLNSERLAELESKNIQADKDSKEKENATADTFDQEQTDLTNKIESGDLVPQADVDRLLQPDSDWRKRAKIIPAAEPAGGNVEQQIAADKIALQVSKIERTGGQRPAKEAKSELVSRIETAIEVAPKSEDVQEKKATRANGQTYVYQPESRTKITIDIPGDGSFTVWNTKESLTELLERAKRVSTTKGTPPKGPSGKSGSTVTEDADAASRAYGSAENAYRSVKRQRDALQSQETPPSSEDRKVWNQQIENAGYLMRELYGKTKAGELEAKAEAALGRLETYRTGAEGFEKEISRLEAVKKKSVATSDRLKDLKERYTQNQDFIKTNEANANKWEQEAAKEKAALESEGQTRQSLARAAVGTETGGWRKAEDGRWYKVGADGKTSGPAASARRQSQLEEQSKPQFLGDKENANANVKFHDAPADEELGRVFEEAKRRLDSQLGRNRDVESMRRVEPEMSDDSVTSRNAMGTASRQAIEQTFGRKIVFFDMGPASPYNGFMVPGLPDHIFINVRTEDPYLVVTGHELLHQIQYGDPSLYAELVNKIQPLLSDFEDYKKKLNEVEIKHGQRPSAADPVLSDLLGDFLGDNFTEKSFWEKLSEKEPNLFVKLAKSVMQFITDVLDRVRNKESYQYFTDLKKAQDVLVNAVAEFSKRRGQTPEQVTGDAKFSLARTPQDYEKQKTFEEAAVAVRSIAAHSDLAGMKTEVADRMGLSDDARRLIGQRRFAEMRDLAIGESGSIENYQQARSWAKTQSPHIQWNVTKDALHSLGYEERRSLDLQQQFQKRLAKVTSPGFIRKVATMIRREGLADIQAEKDETFRNVISVKVQELLNQLNRTKTQDPRTEQLRSDLDRTKKLADWTGAISQKMDQIVSKVYPNYWEMGRASKNGKAFAQLYEAVRTREGNPITDAQERTLVNIAAEILGINSDLSERLYWMEKTRREPDFGPLIDSTSKAFAKRLEEDPGKAIVELMQKTGKQAERAADARSAFRSIQAKVLRELTDFHDYQTAAQADAEIRKSAQWRALVNAVNEDAGAYGIPEMLRDRIRKGLYNTFTGDIAEKDPFGVVHNIKLGWTPEDSIKAQGQIEAYLKSIERWLYEPENENHTDRSFWQRQHDFIDAVYNTLGVLQPGSVKSFGNKFLRKNWDMPQFLFLQAKLPAMKVLQTAFENWHRVLVVGQQWSSGTIAPLMRSVIKAMDAHKMNPNEGTDRYREEIFNSLAWAYRHNKALKPGDKLFGYEVNEADIALLKRMGGAQNELMNKVKNLGASRVMPPDLVFDQWADNAFAIRRPQEFGAVAGTTVPREISQGRGRALATEMSKATNRQQQIAILNDYFKPFVMRWLGERSADYSKPTPFEPLFREIVDRFNNGDPNAARSVDDVIDYINQNSDDTYTREQVQDIVVGGMADEIGKMWRLFFKPDAENAEAQVRTIRASRETPFTTAFDRDQGSSFWYDYGMMNAGEVRSTALDSTMFHLQRMDMSMTAAENSLRDALQAYSKVQGDPMRRLEFLAKQHKLLQTGDDFRDFEALQSQLFELKAFHDRLPTFTGQGVVKYEGLTTLYRLTTDNVLQTLSGLMTTARVFTGSAIKQGLVLSAFERFAAVSYAKSAVSMVMSLSKLATVGPATMIGRRLGLVAPLKEQLSGWAEELFRTNKFFDQQYAYGLGFKNPTLDTISNNLRMPVTHGGGYSAKLSENRGLALLQRGAFRALSVAEAPIETLKTIFPTLGYAVAYDSVARQTYWSIRALEVRARRSFDTYERTGQLGKFDLDNPKSVKNRLTPKDLLSDGILPATETQLSLMREFFRRGTDTDLNDAVMTFWKKLKATPKDRRGDVHLLSADAPDQETAKNLETARAGALASIGLFDVHHASPANRAWFLRSNTFGRLAWPIAGWSIQSTRQWFALMGQAATDPRLRPWAMTTFTAVGILGVLGAQMLGGDLEKRIFSWIKWLAFNEVDPVKHLGEGRDAKEEAKIALSNTFAYIPALNNLIDLATWERGNRQAQINDIFLVDKVKSLMTYANGVAHTGDPLYGLANLARRDAPWLRPLVNRTPGQEGLTNERNVRQVIQKFAPQELIRQDAGSFGMPTPTALSPIKEALANAIYKGDSEGVRDSYYAFIAKATELGRTDPEKLAQQVLRSLNPYSLALATHPTDGQRSEILSKLTDRDRQVLMDGETNFLAASQMLGVGSEMVKQEKGVGTAIAYNSPRGTIAPSASLGRSRLPAISAGRGRVTWDRRVSLGGGTRGLSRPRRLSYVTGRLSAPRRRSIRSVSPRTHHRRKLTLA